MQPPWVRMPDEPARWYARFEVYRLIGPSRTLSDAYRLIAESDGRTGRKPSQSWRQAAQRWRWAERAQAWDAAEAAYLQALPPDSDLDPHAWRRAKVDELLTAVTHAVQNADLGSLGRDEARQILPTLRGLLHDLLVAHHRETELLQAGGQDGRWVPFTADELRLAQAELERWRAEHERPQGAPPETVPTPPMPGVLALRDVLATLYPDEASARRIASQAGLSLARISFSALAVNNWHAILAEAERSEQLPAVVAVVQHEYGANRDLQQALLTLG